MRPFVPLIAALLLIATGAALWLFMRHAPQSQVFEQSSGTSEASSLEWEEDEIEESADPIAPPEDITPIAPTVEILPSDCAQECGDFSSQADRYAYCRSVCGLTLTDPESGTTASPVNPELSRDIERRDAAIRAGDLGACDQIGDEQLKQSCQVRVTEDLLE